MLMHFSILSYIFSLFLPTFDKNAIIYVFSLYKMYDNFHNVKLLKIKLIEPVTRVKQLVQNMLYEIVLPS